MAKTNRADQPIHTGVESGCPISGREEREEPREVMGAVQGY